MYLQTVYSHFKFRWQGELQHTVVKRWKGHASQTKAVPQIIKMDIREQTHDRIAVELADASAPGDVVAATETVADSLDEHHRIAKDESNKLYLGDWTRKHSADPAFKVHSSRLLSLVMN